MTSLPTLDLSALDDAFLEESFGKAPPSPTLMAIFRTGEVASGNEDDSGCECCGADKSGSDCTLYSKDVAGAILCDSARIRAAQDSYRGRFPDRVWSCCSKRCFSMLLIGKPREFHEVLLVNAEVSYARNMVKGCNNFVPARTRGRGASQLTFNNTREGPSRGGFADLDVDGTRQDTRIANHRRACIAGLSFLRGHTKRNGVSVCLCMAASLSVLDLSLNGFYRIRVDGASIVDDSGARSRVLRREKNRGEHGPIHLLSAFQCGCQKPCLSDLSETYLQKVYNEFVNLSSKKGPRKAEQDFLLDFMMCRVTNMDIKFCDKSLAEWFTVGTALVRKMRMTIRQLCEDELNFPKIPEHRMTHYRTLHGPKNQSNQTFREQMADAMNMILRADPAPEKERLVTMRVYCPSINSYAKLLEKVKEFSGLTSEDSSASTFKRLFSSILEERKCRVSFSTADHNVCVHCKAAEQAILRLGLELKIGAKDADEVATLEIELQEEISFYNEHNLRDAKMRKWLGKLTALFKRRENHLIESGEFGLPRDSSWCSLKQHGIVVHQDGMTRVNIPSYFRSSQMDLTAHRYDVNAHVSAITNSATVFSHDLGVGAKDGGSISELVLADLLLTGRGEDIVVIVSDCAAAGRNYVTTVATAQYIVDNELASISIICFLENCHGKWHCDLLFGQFQRKAKSCDFVSIDSMLRIFESINRTGASARVRSYIMNPMACVQWEKNLFDLGYVVEPPGHLRWSDRNPHFATAAKEGALETLDEELRSLIGELLPKAKGMVRLAYATPDGTQDTERPFVQRGIDVPAARNTSRYDDELQESVDFIATSESGGLSDYFVVSHNEPFRPSGENVVSQRTANKLGYNCAKMALQAMSSNKYPELHPSTTLAKQAFPPGYLDIPPELQTVFSVAPENWIIRRPLQTVAEICRSTPSARFPPSNFVNAMTSDAPRNSVGRTCVKTYAEPPFPVIEGTSACAAARVLAQDVNGDLENPVCFLDLLRCVYAEMGRKCTSRTGLCLQYCPSIPPSAAIVEFNALMLLSEKRQQGRPKARRTAYQMFKVDDEVKNIVEGKVAHLPSHEKVKARTAAFKRLWDQYQSDPSKHGVYIKLVEDDSARNAIAMKSFRERQRAFDEENNIAPQQTREDGDLDDSRAVINPDPDRN